MRLDLTDELANFETNMDTCIDKINDVIELGIRDNSKESLKLDLSAIKLCKSLIGSILDNSDIMLKVNNSKILESFKDICDNDTLKPIVISIMKNMFTYIDLDNGEFKLQVKPSE